MKKIAITLLLILVFSNSFAQKNDIWVSFYNQDSTKIGFKDQLGNVKIEPKFVFLTSNQKFENIIATKKTDEKHQFLFPYFAAFFEAF